MLSFRHSFNTEDTKRFLSTQRGSLRRPLIDQSPERGRPKVGRASPQYRDTRHGGGTSFGVTARGDPPCPSPLLTAAGGGSPGPGGGLQRPAAARRPARPRRAPRRPSRSLGREAGKMAGGEPAGAAPGAASPHLT